MNAKMKKYKKITAIMLTAAAISLSVSACRSNNANANSGNVNTSRPHSSSTSRNEGSNVIGDTSNNRPDESGKVLSE